MNDVAALPPSFILIIAGLVYPFVPQRLRSMIAVGMPLLALTQIFLLEFLAKDITLTYKLGEFSLGLIYHHTYTFIFASIFAIAAFAGGIFALNQNRIYEMAAALIYAGSAIGVTYSEDFISFFIYWELMAVASTIIVCCGGTARALQAAIRYAGLHFLGGVLLLMGIVAHILFTNDTALEAFTINLVLFETIDWFDLQILAPLLMLVGVLINVAAPPLSSWLSDSYPESSVSGMVFLSAFTTKTAVFAAITLFHGSDVLIYIGMFMVFYGIVMAILENDMRRILAYSIINQVGFMVTGAGIGTVMALNGAAAHAFCHIMYKALLLMSAGCVLYQTGKRKCTELGGLYHSMPITMACGIIGALAISSFPFTSGFISKSMISTAAEQQEILWVWFGLMAASAGVFLHAGIKFPWFVFFHKDSGLRPKEPPLNMLIAMFILVAGCIIPGFFPETVYSFLPVMPDYEPNTYTHIVTQLQLLLFSGLAFFLMLKLLHRTDTISLDFDWLYRVPLIKSLWFLSFLADKLLEALAAVTKTTLNHVGKRVASVHGHHGVMARAMPIGITILWMTGLLGVYLIIYSLR